MTNDPFQIEVPDEWAKELLAHTPDDHTVDIWSRILRHREGLAAAIRDANKYLKESHLAKLVSAKIAEENLAGSVVGVLIVGEDGRVWMQAQMGDNSKALVITRPEEESLPKMAALRRMATKLEADITPFGRKRRDIWVFLKGEQAKRAAVGIDEAAQALKDAKPKPEPKAKPDPKSPKKKRIKTGDAVPIALVNPKDAGTTTPPEPKPEPEKKAEKKAEKKPKAEKPKAEPNPEAKKPEDNGQKKGSLAALADKSKDKTLSEVEPESSTGGIDIDDLLDLNG